ncbi:integrase arm-type DNA-binding domain-containing protein [Pseudomonas sp. R-28-1W-6]|uniref:tyrosine-type recombinase/integrase n=1 Tax=Pseudomonas sp. R-28-1W-6 TaxID=2650101 RepID=UPI001365BF7E|nr:integrase arm-type DNA-binding domain-containing protein [Pseudomonas sp. R-28-1W-6]MWV11149.1 integrase arm-type DNA-binding domain-containing protein [Pseudomonas sp. R-28-1W-6]
MPSIRLTAIAVERLTAPEKGRKDIYDAEVPGLVLRISSTGVKSWSFTYRVKGQPRRLTLGAHPGVSLKLARDRAREARAAIQRGEDPVEDRKEAERERQLNGFTSCAREFVERYAKPRQRTWKETQRILEKLAIPVWGDKPVKEIRRRDVVELLDNVAVKTPHQANRLRAYLSRLFKWLIEREVVEVSPIIGVAPRIKPVARSRILSDAELVALWKATGRLGGVFGAATRFLMTTGVRRNEASFLRWDELDGTWAAMPASRMKGGRDFRAALSPAALAILDGMPRFAGCPYVFTTNGRTPISGWGKAKVRLDEYMSTELGESVGDWRLHDLRRTLASGLAGLGTRSEVIKRVLGHAASSSDVTAVHYVWHGYDAEALAAVQAWGDHINELVSGAGARAKL